MGIYVAVNRLTGAYLAEHTSKAKLKKWVQTKGRPGLWVDINYHGKDGSLTKVAGFMVEKRK